MPLGTGMPGNDALADTDDNDTLDGGGDDSLSSGTGKFLFVQGGEETLLCGAG